MPVSMLTLDLIFEVVGTEYNYVREEGTWLYCNFFLSAYWFDLFPKRCVVVLLAGGQVFKDI